MSCGTVVRISEEGLCVTAWDSVVEDGRLLPVQAWGAPLALIAGCPYDNRFYEQGRLPAR